MTLAMKSLSLTNTCIMSLTWVAGIHLHHALIRSIYSIHYMCFQAYMIVDTSYIVAVADLDKHTSERIRRRVLDCFVWFAPYASSPVFCFYPFVSYHRRTHVFITNRIGSRYTGQRDLLSRMHCFHFYKLALTQCLHTKNYIVSILAAFIRIVMYM